MSSSPIQESFIDTFFRVRDKVYQSQDKTLVSRIWDTLCTLGLYITKDEKWERYAIKQKTEPLSQTEATTEEVARIVLPPQKKEEKEVTSPPLTKGKAHLKSLNFTSFGRSADQVNVVELCNEIQSLSRWEQKNDLHDCYEQAAGFVKRAKTQGEKDSFREQVDIIVEQAEKFLKTAVYNSSIREFVEKELQSERKGDLVDDQILRELIPNDWYRVLIKSSIKTAREALSKPWEVKDGAFDTFIRTAERLSALLGIPFDREKLMAIAKGEEPMPAPPPPPKHPPTLAIKKLLANIPQERKEALKDYLKKADKAWIQYPSELLGSDNVAKLLQEDFFDSAIPLSTQEKQAILKFLMMNHNLL